MTRSEQASLARDLHTLRDREVLDWSKRSKLDLIDDMLRRVEVEAPILNSEDRVAAEKV